MIAGADYTLRFMGAERAKTNLSRAEKVLADSIRYDWKPCFREAAIAQVKEAQRVLETFEDVADLIQSAIS